MLRDQHHGSNMELRTTKQESSLQASQQLINNWLLANKEGPTKKSVTFDTNELATSHRAGNVLIFKLEQDQCRAGLVTVGLLGEGLALSDLTEALHSSQELVTGCVLTRINNRQTARITTGFNRWQYLVRRKRMTNRQDFFFTGYLNEDSFPIGGIVSDAPFDHIYQRYDLLSSQLDPVGRMIGWAFKGKTFSATILSGLKFGEP